MIIKGFSDVDWGGDIDTWMSTSGRIFTLSSCPVLRSSVRQKVSTLEAEVIALSELMKSAGWLKNHLIELDCRPQTTEIICDNQATIKAITNDEFSKKLKHINIRKMFAKELLMHPNFLG